MKIAINSLSDYNEGRLIYKWFEIQDYSSLYELQDAITEWLDELNEEDGGGREEWSVGDTENIPEAFVGPYGVASELWDYVDLLDRGADEDVIAAGISLGIPLYKVLEAYRGTYDSDERMAMSFADDIELLEGVPLHVKQYFDWEAYACDLMLQEFNEVEGHYFYIYW